MRYGFLDPPRWDKNLNQGTGGIVEGNGRLETLFWMFKQGQSTPRGIAVDTDGEWCVPVLFGLDAESEATAAAYSIDHNNLTLAGGDGFTALDVSRLYEPEAYTKLLQELAEVEMLPISVDLDDLNLLLEITEQEPQSKPEEDEEATHKLVEKAGRGEIDSRVSLGQIWQLGRHRILCGDSTDEQQVRSLLGDRRFDIIFTDPPYSVSYADKNRSLNAVGRGNRIQTPIKNDHFPVEETAKKVWLPAFKNLFDFAKPGCVYYLTAPQGGDQMMMMMMMAQAGWLVKHELIWVKNNHVLGRADYHYKHEPILYGWKPGASHYFIDSRSEFSVWEFDKPLKSDLHPTMKPVGLIAKAINNSSRIGELVGDFFLGSGSTLIAAQECDRTVYGMELSEIYCEIIIQRWEKLTGKIAQLVTSL